MPLTTVRGIGLQNIQHYAITDNPVFKIKVRSLATNIEQSVSNQKQSKKDFIIGDNVYGKKLGSSKYYTGKITNIDKNKNYVIIINNKDNKKIKIDKSSIQKIKKNKEK